MAGLPWIKVWTVIPAHPKVQRLEKRLGIKDALGIVIRLWCWAAEYHPGGEIPTDDETSLGKSARGDAVKKSPESVVLALVDAGFLDRIPGGYRVHDWDEMQTRHIEEEEKRKEQAKERQKRYRERHVTRDVTRDCDVTVTQSNATDKIRVDKTREDQRVTSRPVVTDRVERFRERLAGRLGVQDLGVGRDTPEVVAFFESQLDAVGEESLLVECCDLAPKFKTSPGNLSAFVGWLKRLPMPANEARQ